MRPWASTEAFTDMVERYRSIGINEFVLYWPRTWDSRASQEDTVFERVMSDVAPGLKASSRWVGGHAAALLARHPRN
jgi:hypothetical protein